MEHMKYFIFVGELGLPTPIIFCSSLSHYRVARNLLNPHNWDEEGDMLMKIISAGFVILDDQDGIMCYGQSSTLDGIQCRGQEDSDLINMMLGRED